jgi:hypothetical protein
MYAASETRRLKKPNRMTRCNFPQPRKYPDATSSLIRKGLYPLSMSAGEGSKCETHFTKMEKLYRV